ncbi:MAG: hypothetical protein ACR2OE_13175 [Thermomicrobiales bacterium]
MPRRIATLLLLALALSSCSYSYGVLATVRNGRVVFIVDPASSQQPSCLRRIEVIAEYERDPIWEESVSYDDDCENKFPLPYGARLEGQHQQNQKMADAKPLRRGITYEVSTTTGATGYGGGRFVVRPDGRLENLPYREEAAQESKTSSNP